MSVQIGRYLRGRTQEELARVLGVSRTMLYSYDPRREELG